MKELHKPSLPSGAKVIDERNTYIRLQTDHLSNLDNHLYPPSVYRRMAESDWNSLYRERKGF